MNWTTTSENFQDPTARHDYPTIRQLGIYCQADFNSKGVKYSLFGRIKGMYIVGDGSIRLTRWDTTVSFNFGSLTPTP
jgi:hypothetical protein